MTKRSQKTESDIIHATSAVTEDAVVAALYEQLYQMIGPAAFADFLAARLRDPSPHPAILLMVARWLDPQSNDSLALVVVRRRRGKTWRKHVNDAAVAEAVLKRRQAAGNKRGSLKNIAAEVAFLYGVKEPTVRKAMRSKMIRD